MSHGLWTKRGIEGGNWTAVLSGHWREKLGGIATIRQALATEPFRVDEYPGGAMILAAPVPEIGDRNHRIGVPNYRKLAHLLKPIRTYIARREPSGGTSSRQGRLASPRPARDARQQRQQQHRADACTRSARFKPA